MARPVACVDLPLVTESVHQARAHDPHTQAGRAHRDQLNLSSGRRKSAQQPRPTDQPPVHGFHSSHAGIATSYLCRAGEQVELPHR